MISPTAANSTSYEGVKVSVGAGVSVAAGVSVSVWVAVGAGVEVGSRDVASREGTMCNVSTGVEVEMVVEFPTQPARKNRTSPKQNQNFIEYAP
jgi:hypothetical protein